MEHESATPATKPLTAKPPASGRFGLGSLIFVALVSSGVTALALRTFSARSGVLETTELEHEIYQCPMHPAVIQEHPGTCPICGMKLVKVDTPIPIGSAQADMGASIAPTPDPSSPAVEGLAPVDIDPARQQLVGLQTVEVTRGPIAGAWRTVGRVAMDETRVRHVNLKVGGFVERIFVDFVGKRVSKGDPLFSLYSPELLAAQEEYLLALRTQKALTGSGVGVENGQALVAAARRKLGLWDVSEAELERMATTGEPTKSLMFHSPVAGVVTRKDVVEGMKLDAGAMPYEVVDLSSLWVLADVYESELRFVKEGMGAKLSLNAFPDREFRGKVVFIDPLLDPLTRTVKVRLTFPNPKGELRPEMFGEVVLLGEPHDGLLVPQDAIIDSGTRKVVFVAQGDGKFTPRAVKLGKTDGANVEVLSGVELGERVVTRANFLIDSESRLRASLAMQNGVPSMTPRLESARVLPGASVPLASTSTAHATLGITASTSEVQVTSTVSTTPAGRSTAVVPSTAGVPVTSAHAHQASEHAP